MPDDEFEFETPAVDADFFKEGGNTLSETEIALLGDVNGLSVLVMPAAMGEEALSLLNMGAKVTVLDSGEDLEAVQTLVDEGGFALTLIDDDPNSIDMVNRKGAFDIVYSPWGAVDWVSNLPDWAVGIADMLRQGGRLIGYDEHPMAYTVEEDAGRLIVAHSYFGEIIDEDEDGEPDTPLAIEGDERSDFSWTIGDLINALGNAGLARVRFDEYPESDRFETPLDRFTTADEETLGRVPSAVLFAAIKL